MKQFLIFLLIAVFSSMGMAPDAEARRLGGGGSFGMKRQVTPPKAPQQNLNRPGQSPGGAQTPPGRRSWMGPIAGLAAGLGLAALFSHLGLGPEMASFFTLLLLVVGGFLLFRFLRRRFAPAQGANDFGRMQYAGNAPADVNRSRIQPVTPSSGAAAGKDQGFGDFDSESFLKQAKVNFIRLQAAHDEGNLADIREFTSPEVFAEIRLQMAERGDEANQTDVVELQAEIVDVTEEASRYIVTVRFHGLIREQQDQPPQPFDEMWHMSKSKDSERGWVVAGIQQVS